MKIRSVLLLLIMLTMPFALAEAPRTIGYSGQLKNGDEYVNGEIDMSFAFFADASSDEVLWQETHPSVEVDQGFFSVSLGSINPFTVDFKNQYWLEIQLNDDEPMSPRLKLESAPYAERADDAPSWVAVDASGSVIGEPVGIEPTRYTLVTEGGYLYVFNPRDGIPLQGSCDSTPSFKEANCGGNAYFDSQCVAAGQLFSVYGSQSSAADDWYYIPFDAKLNASVSVRSFLDKETGGCCDLISGAGCLYGPGSTITNENQYEAKANDPSVTGLTRREFATPITFEKR